MTSKPTANPTPQTTPTTPSAKRRPEEYSSVLRGERPSNGIFAAFMPQPHGVGFESQHEHEEILLVLRQHPVVNVVWVTITIILMLAPFLLFPMIPLQVILPGVYMFFLMVAWYLFVTAYVIESFLGWYFNIYIITDERIIDIDFYSLIYKSVSEAKIEKIEDVTSTTAGFFGAFFNYGNIAIQTAAEKREFEFARVPQPAKITKFLNELMIEEEREKIEGRVM
ncbi:PH domain-containing protein [Candidatus Woesebacteria bacterium]|nr:PH domain-containing protein [Candidatus Woesebacteria bacterium]